MQGGVLLDRRTGRPVVDDRLRAQLLDRPRYLEHVEKLIGRAVEFPNLVATERNPPLYMDVSNAYSGDELGLPWRDVMGEGVVGTGDLAVTAHGGANSVDVAAGSAWVLGDTNPAAQPNYRVYNDAVVNLGISPDPSNPRYVLVVAQVTDQGFSGTGRLWALTAIHGTPAGTPAIPAVPASALMLATVLVPANAASSAVYTINDIRPHARVGGGQTDIFYVGPWSAGPPNQIAGAANGIMWLATGVDANGTNWLFRYNASSGSTYKWEFVAGPPVHVGSDGNSAAPSAANAWVLMGPTFTAVRGGDYMLGGSAILATNATAGTRFMSVGSSTTGGGLGTLGAVADVSKPAVPAGGGGFLPVTGVAAGGTLGLYYFGPTTGDGWSRIHLSVLPIRVA